MLRKAYTVLLLLLEASPPRVSIFVGHVLPLSTPNGVLPILMVRLAFGISPTSWGKSRFGRDVS